MTVSDTLRKSRKLLAQLYYEQHLSIRDIADHFSCSQELVSNIMEELGMKRRRAQGPRASILLKRDLLTPILSNALNALDLTPKDFAEKIDVPYTTLIMNLKGSRAMRLDTALKIADYLELDDASTLKLLRELRDFCATTIED